MNVMLAMLLCSTTFITNSTGLNHLLYTDEEFNERVHLLYTDEAASSERVEEMESNMKLINDMQVLYHSQSQRFDGIESNIELLYTHSCACMLFILLFAWMQCFINCMHRKVTDEHTIDAVVINTSNDETFKKT